MSTILSLARSRMQRHRGVAAQPTPAPAAGAVSAPVKPISANSDALSKMETQLADLRARQAKQLAGNFNPTGTAAPKAPASDTAANFIATIDAAVTKAHANFDDAPAALAEIANARAELPVKLEKWPSGFHQFLSSVDRIVAHSKTSQVKFAELRAVNAIRAARESCFGPAPKPAAAGDAVKTLTLSAFNTLLQSDRAQFCRDGGKIIS